MPHAVHGREEKHCHCLLFPSFIQRHLPLHSASVLSVSASASASSSSTSFSRALAAGLFFFQRKYTWKLPEERLLTSTALPDSPSPCQGFQRRFPGNRKDWGCHHDTTGWESLSASKSTRQIQARLNVPTPCIQSSMTTQTRWLDRSSSAHCFPLP